MRISLLTVALTLVVFTSCKKESSTGSAGTTGTNSGSATITPSNATTFYGIFNEYHLQSVSGSTLTSTWHYCTAFFTNNPSQYPNSSVYTKVASAGMNGVVFGFQSYHYVDTTYSVTFPPATWQVTGLGSIPSFTYTNSTPFPTYSAYASLPDTVHIGPSLVISTTGSAGYSDITVSVSDANSHITAGMLASGANSVTLSTSSLVATTSGTLIFSLSKNNVQSVNGKDMNFITTYQLSKAVVIN